MEKIKPETDYLDDYLDRLDQAKNTLKNIRRKSKHKKRPYFEITINIIERKIYGKIQGIDTETLGIKFKNFKNGKEDVITILYVKEIKLCNKEEITTLML